MADPITIDRDSEFFISIGKSGVHSFLMLGVMNNGKPEILAKVGKSNLIDKDFGTSCAQQFTMFGKVVGSRTEALLVDEGIGDDQDLTISYQAYSINYKQYLECLAMIRDIHKDQLEHYNGRAQPEGEYRKLSYPEKGVRKLRSGIWCYVPKSEDIPSGKITLDLDTVDTFTPESANKDEQSRQSIIHGAKEIKALNTCRTTARSILNYILGYSPDIPALFAIGLSYKTTLNEGKLNSNTFYILPPPPNSFKGSPTQMKVLSELYKKLENMPKSQPESEITRKKFDALKTQYQQLAGKSELSLGELLDEITVHRTKYNALFDRRRAEGIISQFAEALGLKTGTQKAYDRMEKTIQKEIKRLGKEEEKMGKGSNKRDFQSDDHRPPHATSVYNK